MSSKRLRLGLFIAIGKTACGRIDGIEITPSPVIHHQKNNSTVQSTVTSVLLPNFRETEFLMDLIEAEIILYSTQTSSCDDPFIGKQKVDGSHLVVRPLLGILRAPN